MSCNEKSGGVAVAIPTNSQVDENGGIVKVIETNLLGSVEFNFPLTVII